MGSLIKLGLECPEVLGMTEVLSLTEMIFGSLLMLSFVGCFFIWTLASSTVFAHYSFFVFF